jgi:2-methylisocitrate lyase-like PEP mutase family enzyme
MTDQADRCRVFRQLHQSGCFVIPNPWDAGSARLLAQLGFPALATTSSGFAWSLGKPDNSVSIEDARPTSLDHPRGRGAGERGLEASLPQEAVA